ncbi:hypothetical protein ACLMJK_007594 [Lecanora helva]
MDDPPTIPILLLGDPDCGKSTFLSKLSHGTNSTRHTTHPLPLLRDLDQPFIWHIRLYNRHYTFEFSDTSSPENYTLLSPSFIILCYDISSRPSLENLQHVWFKQMVECYMREREDIPVLVLGLKRDLRGVGGGIGDGDGGGGLILPQEGVRVAQELRADRYAECSALTGELMDEVIEDVARTACKTATEKGGKTEGGCGVM